MAFLVGVGAAETSDPMKSTVVRVEREATIGRPIEEVFERLADVRGYSAWMPRTGLFGSCQPAEDGRTGAEASYRDSSRIGPWRGRVSTFRHPTQLEFRQTLRWFGKAVMQARPTYVLETDDGATVVRHVAEGELYGIFRAMKPMTALMAKRERRLVMEALKTSLEGADGNA